MTMNEIYNLIIAAVPSVSAIVSGFIIFAKLFTSFRDMRNGISKKNKELEDSVAKLAEIVAKQQKEIDEIKETIKELNYTCRKVIDHVDTRK